MSAKLRKRGRAVELLAQGDLTHEQIAATLGVDERTIRRWLGDAAFVADLEAAQEAIRAAIRAEGIANKQNRIDAYNDRWERMRRVIAERADDPVYAGVAGGSTGLLVRSFKMVGAGRDAQLVEEFAVDTALLAEMRQTEKQAAQELGQWTEKQELTSDPKRPLRIRVEYDDGDLGPRVSADLAATATTLLPGADVPGGEAV